MLNRKIGPNQAERIWGAEQQLGVAVNSDKNVTFQASQELWADLNRLCISAFTIVEAGSAGTSPIANDMLALCTVVQIKIKGAYQIIRGSGSPVCPASAFGTGRSWNPYKLMGSNWVHFASGEQLVLTLRGESATFKPNFVASLPVVLACDLNQRAILPSTMVSPGAAIMGTDLVNSSFTSNTIDYDITFDWDDAGTLGLSGLVLGATQTDSVATDSAAYGLNLIPSTTVRQITTLDKSQLIVGTAAGGGTISVPAGLFGPPSAVVSTAHPWSLLAQQTGSAGSTVTISLTSMSALAGQVDSWAGCPYYPTGAQGPAGTC